MRYILMLQLVSIITLNLVMGSALFAWLQSRPTSEVPDATSYQFSKYPLHIEHRQSNPTESAIAATPPKGDKPTG